MLVFFKKYYLLIIFSFLFLVYSYFNVIGPWDEYHLLYYFKNKLFFPLYDNNFPYYDTYLLGRFSPITGQEFNIPILLGLDLNYSFFIVAIIILLTFVVYFFTLGNYFNKKYFILFILFILSSPSFYILSTRVLYAEDTSALLLIIFLSLFLKCIELELPNNKFLWNILLILSTFFTLLYKENNFVIIITFVFSYLFYDSKKINKNKFVILLILLCSIIYLLILSYINLFYKSNELAYVQNLNWNFLNNSLITLVRYSVLNDPVLFFIFLPVALFSFNKTKNIFFKSMFIAGISNILFFVSMGLYGPYYLYINYFLFFPLFCEGIKQFMNLINFKKKLFILFAICLVFASFLNSIFYYFESRSLSSTFNNTVKYLVKKINNKESVTKIFICNNLSEGMLAHVYIIGEHMKYNNIQVSNFEFYSLTNNNRNVLNSKLSPFDNDDYNYRNSIFQNKYKTTLPKRGDLLLNIYSYSLKNENSCNFWKTSGYKKIFSSTMSFVNTLTSNLIKVLFYKNEFRKEHYLKKFGYEIFEIE